MTTTGDMLRISPVSDASQAAAVLSTSSTFEPFEAAAIVYHSAAIAVLCHTILRYLSVHIRDACPIHTVTVASPIGFDASFTLESTARKAPIVP